MNNLSESQKEKIRRFINDSETSATIFYLIQDMFLNEKSADVSYLAASRLSVDCLKRAWKEMDKYRTAKGQDGDKNPTPHL